MSDAPQDVDLVLDTTTPREATSARLDALLDGSAPVASTGEARDATQVDAADDVVGCLACDLANGRRPLPGGRIFETDHLVVEHGVGPLGLASLIVKPTRHVTALAELTDIESTELGPLLRLTASVAGQLVEAEQVHACLWSHAEGAPAHLHFVVQPVTRTELTRLDALGRGYRPCCSRRTWSPHPRRSSRSRRAPRRCSMPGSQAAEERDSTPGGRGSVCGNQTASADARSCGRPAGAGA